MTKARAKKSAPAAAATTDQEIPVVGGREPCPCGSGKRYKVCHGRAAARAADVLVRRPFEGLMGECDLVAMREIVPSATVAVRLAADYAIDGVDVRIATVLPMAWPALRRADGNIVVAMQTAAGGGDASRDVAAALLLAADAVPGTPVAPVGLAGPGPRLQDVIAADSPFEVKVHQGFDYWLEGVETVSDEVNASMSRANEGLVPTERLTGVDAAYWCRIGTKEHLRWVLPYEEDALRDAFARLHAAGADTLGEGTRWIGAFRAHGLLAPVWDLVPGAQAQDVEGPAEEYLARLRDALTITTPLTDSERRARAGVAARQLTLR